MDQNNERVETSGLNIGGDAVKDKGCLTSVALYLFGGITDLPENYTNDVYFNKSTLEVLDYGDYFKHLVTSLCNYMVIEKRPEIALYLDDDYILESNKSEKELEEEMNKEISKIRNKLTNEIYRYYYPTRKVKITGSNTILKKGKNDNKNVVSKLGDIANIISETHKLETELRLKDKFIYKPNAELRILLKRLDISLLTKNLNLLNKRMNILKKCDEGIDDIVKIDRLMILYNHIESILINERPEYKDKKFKVKMAINSNLKNKIKFDFSYNIGLGWIGAPQSRIEKNGEIMGYKNTIPYTIFHSDRDFETFITLHVPSFEFTQDRKQFTITYDDYDRFINTLALLFTN